MLGEGCSYFIGKSLSSIVETGRIPGRGDCAFEENSAETLALRRRNRWPAAFLPSKENGGLCRSGIERPAHRNGAGVGL